MNRRLVFSVGCVAVWMTGCADPCLDDGLSQQVGGDCAAASASDSASASMSASDTDPIPVEPTEGDSVDDDSVSGTGTTGGPTGTDADSDSETETESDTSTGTDTGETTQWCADEDGDGYGDPDECEDVPVGQDPPGGTVDNDEDCDDDNENTFPGAAPNDDATACMNDDDGDDWGDDDPGPGIDAGTDCIDTNENAFPGAAPNDDALACMEDVDDDDWGNSDPPAGADAGTDCDDTDVATPVPNVCLLWCLDADDDNYGDPDNCVELPDPPPGHVGNDSDCDDDNPFAFPGAAPNDDALACMEDVDGDDWGDDNPPAGVDAGTDCDDDSEATFPGSSPNDDLTACMKDVDGDDWGDDSPPSGVDAGTDCDDESIDAFPGAAPNDDPTACMLDEDGDDWGDDSPPAGVDPGTDCRDDNMFAFPGAAPNDDPVACMEDVDGDDWGDWIPPIGVATGTDCADNNANAYPGAAPNDHPNACMEDEDDDDWGDENPPAGVTAGNDCDDTNPAVPISVVGLPTTCADAQLQEGSLGCEFVASPLPHIDVGETIVFDVALSNPSTTQSATVNIERFILGAWATVSGPHVVGAQSQTRVGLPLNGANTSGIYAGATYRVVSDIPIAVYQRSSQTFSTDASLLLPTNTWSMQYAVVGWDGLQNPFYPGLEEYVAVIALADNTSVTVTPSRNTNGAGGVPAGVAGSPVNFTLDEGELAVVASQGQGGETAQSLTGTLVEADGPVAVFTGTECSNVPSGVTACDHLEEQLLPLANVSQTYVASRVAVRNATTPEPVIWQVYALEDVMVEFEGHADVTGLPVGPVALSPGETLQLDVTGSAAQPGDFLITASGNILVAQYVTGQDDGGEIGDPAMLQLPSFSQMVEDYAVGTYPGFAAHYLTVTRQVGESVTLDGAVIPNASFAAVGSDWEVARVQVAEGTHLLSSDEPFSVIATGYNAYDSYTYVGGVRTNDLVCSVPP